MIVLGNDIKLSVGLIHTGHMYLIHPSIEKVFGEGSGHIIEIVIINQLNVYKTTVTSFSLFIVVYICFIS